MIKHYFLYGIYFFTLFFMAANASANRSSYDGILNLYLYPVCEGEKAVDFSVCAIREEIAQNLIYKNNKYTIFDSKYDYPARVSIDDFSYTKPVNLICNSNEHLQKRFKNNKYIRLRVENPSDPYFRKVFRLKYDPKILLEKYEEYKNYKCILQQEKHEEDYRLEQERKKRLEQEREANKKYWEEQKEKTEKQELVEKVIVFTIVGFVFWIGWLLLTRLIKFLKQTYQRAPEVLNEVDSVAQKIKTKVVESIKNNETIKEIYLHLQQGKSNSLSVPEEIIGLLSKLAASDGKISKEEKEEVSAVISTMIDAMRHAGLSADIIDVQKVKLYKIANESNIDNNPISYYCQSLSIASDEIRVGAFMQLVVFSAIDGFSDKTLFILKEIGYSLGLVDEFIEDVINVFSFDTSDKSNSTNQAEDPYEILGCEKSDSFDEIKKKYRKLVRKYHPDFLHGKKMSDEEIKKATLKLQEINAAFDEIKKEKRD